MFKVKYHDETYGALDHAEVLELVNKVRAAWGWSPLEGLPQGSPGRPCSCVLGKAWTAHIIGTGFNAPVNMTFNDDNWLTETAAKALGVETVKLYRDVKAVFPLNHPLIVWMTLFDAGKFPELDGGEDPDGFVDPEAITFDAARRYDGHFGLDLDDDVELVA